MREFFIRTVSALVLILLIIGITLSPAKIFVLFMGLFVSLSAWEMGRLIGGRGFFPILGAVNAFALLIGIYLFSIPPVMVVIVIFTGLLSLLTTAKQEIKNFPLQLASALLPPFILSPTLFYLFLIWEKNIYHLYFLILVISIGDTAAYILGTKFGKHKIYPVASPNKSWEGFLAALFFAGLTGLLGKFVGLKWGFIIGFFSALSAQLSDPFESLFKRAAGVKDSSNLIPGHGGFLDRIDSYIFAAPVFYYLVKFIGK